MLDRQPFFFGQPNAFCNRAKHRTKACLAVWLSLLAAPLPFIKYCVPASFVHYGNLPLCLKRRWLLLAILGFCFFSTSYHLDFHWQQILCGWSSLYAGLYLIVGRSHLLVKRLSSEVIVVVSCTFTFLFWMLRSSVVGRLFVCLPSCCNDAVNVAAAVRTDSIVRYATS